jgi:hypothetical protein
MDRIHITWGDEVLDRGFTAVPNLFLDRYHLLGVTPVEMMVLLHICQRKAGDEETWPFVSVREIARKMGIDERNVRQHLANLEKPQRDKNGKIIRPPLIIRETRPGRPSTLNLAPFREAILAAEGQRPGQTEPSTPDENIRPTPDENIRPTPDENIRPTPDENIRPGCRRPPTPDENIRPPRMKTSADSDSVQDFNPDLSLGEVQNEAPLLRKKAEVEDGERESKVKLLCSIQLSLLVAEEIARHYDLPSVRALIAQIQEWRRDPDLRKKVGALLKEARGGRWNVDPAWADPLPDPGQIADRETQDYLSEVALWRTQAEATGEETRQALESARARLPWQQETIP